MRQRGPATTNNAYAFLGGIRPEEEPLVRIVLGLQKRPALSEVAARPSLPATRIFSPQRAEIVRIDAK